MVSPWEKFAFAAITLFVSLQVVPAHPSIRKPASRAFRAETYVLAAAALPGLIPATSLSIMTWVSVLGQSYALQNDTLRWHQKLIKYALHLLYSSSRWPDVTRVSGTLL
jgi:hypothetical protein